MFRDGAAHLFVFLDHPALSGRQIRIVVVVKWVLSCLEVALAPSIR